MEIGCGLDLDKTTFLQVNALATFSVADMVLLIILFYLET